MKKLTQSRGIGLVLAAVGVLMMAFGIYRGEMMVYWNWIKTQR